MTARCDIAVVGSGAAGIAAAISAARAGLNTILFDQRPGPGGIGGHSGLTTLCGLYNEHGQVLNDGFVCEFAEQLAETTPQRMGRTWVLLYRPERFRALSSDLLSACEQLQMRWNTPLQQVELSGERIVRVNGIEADAIIDCTGSAEVALSAGAPCLETDDSTQAPATVFQLQGVMRVFNGPADVVQVLLPVARAGLPPVSFHPSLEPHTLTMKFAGVPRQVPELVEFLRTSIPGFETCQAVSSAVQSQRAGRMIVGQYVLTGADVLSARRFPDAVARCAWPVEQWDAKGVVRFRYLNAGDHYEIPARSLRALNIKNLFMAGKTISADPDAIASARVMGCCLATGAAAGNLAARYLQSPAN